MKINIVKKGDAIVVEFTKDTATAPVSANFTAEQIDMLISLLTTAKTAKVFRFTLDL